MGIFRTKITLDWAYLLNHVNVVNGCWEWTGTVARHGYAVVNHTYVHRFSYEYMNGEIPHGCAIDHLCRNRKCVRPDHLEAVSQRENIIRGMGTSAWNARKQSCINGHAFTEANTYIRKDNGNRQCRACRRESFARWKEQHASIRLQA